MSPFRLPLPPWATLLGVLAVLAYALAFAPTRVRNEYPILATCIAIVGAVAASACCGLTGAAVAFVTFGENRSGQLPISPLQDASVSELETARGAFIGLLGAHVGWYLVMTWVVVVAPRRMTVVKLPTSDRRASSLFLSSFVGLVVTLCGLALSAAYARVAGLDSYAYDPRSDPSKAIPNAQNRLKIGFYQSQAWGMHVVNFVLVIAAAHAIDFHASARTDLLGLMISKVVASSTEVRDADGDARLKTALRELSRFMHARDEEDEEEISPETIGVCGMEGVTTPQELKTAVQRHIRLSLWFAVGLYTASVAVLFGSSLWFHLVTLGGMSGWLNSVGILTQSDSLLLLRFADSRTTVDPVTGRLVGTERLTASTTTLLLVMLTIRVLLLSVPPAYEFASLCLGYTLSASYVVWLAVAVAVSPRYTGSTEEDNTGLHFKSRARLYIGCSVGVLLASTCFFVAVTIVVSQSPMNPSILTKLSAESLDYLGPFQSWLLCLIAFFVVLVVGLVSFSVHAPARTDSKKKRRAPLVIRVVVFLLIVSGAIVVEGITDASFKIGIAASVVTLTPTIACVFLGITEWRRVDFQFNKRVTLLFTVALVGLVSWGLALYYARRGVTHWSFIYALVSEAGAICCFTAGLALWYNRLEWNRTLRVICFLGTLLHVSALVVVAKEGRFSPPPIETHGEYVWPRRVLAEGYDYNYYNQPPTHQPTFRPSRFWDDVTDDVLHGARADLRLQVDLFVLVPALLCLSMIVLNRIGVRRYVWVAANKHRLHKPQSGAFSSLDASSSETDTVGKRSANLTLNATNESGSAKPLPPPARSKPPKFSVEEEAVGGSPKHVDSEGTMISASSPITTSSSAASIQLPQTLGPRQARWLNGFVLFLLIASLLFGTIWVWLVFDPTSGVIHLTCVIAVVLVAVPSTVKVKTIAVIPVIVVFFIFAGITGLGMWEIPVPRILIASSPRVYVICGVSLFAIYLLEYALSSVLEARMQNVSLMPWPFGGGGLGLPVVAMDMSKEELRTFNRPVLFAVLAFVAMELTMLLNALVTSYYVLDPEPLQFFNPADIISACVFFCALLVFAAGVTVHRFVEFRRAFERTTSDAVSDAALVETLERCRRLMRRPVWDAPWMKPNGSKRSCWSRCVPASFWGGWVASMGSSAAFGTSKNEDRGYQWALRLETGSPAAEHLFYLVYGFVASRRLHHASHYPPAAASPDDSSGASSSGGGVMRFAAAASKRLQNRKLQLDGPKSEREYQGEFPGDEAAAPPTGKRWPSSSGKRAGFFGPRRSSSKRASSSAEEPASSSSPPPTIAGDLPVKRTSAYQLRSQSLLEPFVDAQFRAANAALLGPAWDDELERVAQEESLSLAKWMRPREICVATGIDPALAGLRSISDLDTSVNPREIVQGDVGDCWLLSALSVVATRRDLLNRVLPSMRLNAQGNYVVRLFDSRSGKWDPIVVDDRLPCDHDTNQPLYARSLSGATFWMSIVEKAFAKRAGSWASLEGGHVHTALVELTGGFAELLAIQDDAVQIESGSLWNDLCQHAERGDLLVAGSLASTRHGQQAEISDVGIMLGHAYSVLRIAEISDRRGTHRIVELRDPWGAATWKGPWSDSDTVSWTRRAQRLLHRDLMDTKTATNRDDGVFWMDIESFVSNFKWVFGCRFFREDGEEGWRHASMQGEWKGASAGGPPNTSTTCNNPQFRIRVTPKAMRKTTAAFAHEPTENQPLNAQSPRSWVQRVLGGRWRPGKEETRRSTTTPAGTAASAETATVFFSLTNVGTNLDLVAPLWPYMSLLLLDVRERDAPTDRFQWLGPHTRITASHVVASSGKYKDSRSVSFEAQVPLGADLILLPTLYPAGTEGEFRVDVFVQGPHDVVLERLRRTPSPTQESPEDFIDDVV